MEKELLGVRIHYERMGAGEKRVVLLHGWGCDLTTMRSVASALEDGAQILSLDFPAHGKSEKPPEPWGMEQFSQCLRMLLEAERFLPCAAVAHSFGCRVAIKTAAEHPETFTRLVLTGAAGIRLPQSEEAKKRLASYRRLKRIIDGMKRIPIAASLTEKAETMLRQKYGSKDYNALDEEMRKTFVRVISEDLTPCLSSVRQPTLLLWGDNDLETPLWMGKKMEELIPDAALIPLQGGSHFAYLEQAERFGIIVRNFLLEGEA